MTTEAAAPARGFDGLSAHPRGLSTLFLTEMWERFSYYGMRGLLILFMVDAMADGGLGLDDRRAAAIYGLYTAAVYLVTLPGGWIADRLLGAQRAIWYGGIIIMCGHITLAIPATQTFYIGLILVALGTGLLKPNISAVVGELYSPGDARRDSGFTLFYMGINIGAFAGGIVCGWLADNVGWHVGFGAAAVGMFFGLVQYKLSIGRLGAAGRDASLKPDDPDDRRRLRNGWRIVSAALTLIAIVTGLIMVGALSVDPESLARSTTVIIVTVAVLYFAYLFVAGGLTTDEKRRLVVIIVLFFAAAMFWAGFEQAGSSLNLFAERYTQRQFGGFTIPAAWFQSVNPLFIFLIAPFVSALWLKLAQRNLNPSTPAKFALGLVLLGAGFAVMIGAAQFVAQGDKVLPTWLLTTYLLHTLGELALSPVGLSATTKLAPRRYVGQMMGVWFVGSALGSLIAGLLAGEFNEGAVDQMPALYTQIVFTAVGSGLLLALFTRPIRKLMGDVE